MNVFIGLTEVAGYYQKVSRGLSELGHKADFYCLFHNRMNYRIPNESKLPKAFNRFIRFLEIKKAKNILWRIFRRLAVELLRLLLLATSVFYYDRYIFSYSGSFLPWNIDVPLLRLAGKSVLFIYHGSDSRPPYLNGDDFFRLESDVDLIRRHILRKKDAISRVEKWANWIIDNPASAHLHSRPIINWYQIGNPCIRSEGGISATNNSLEIIALHAPSNPHIKGTALILEAVESLKSEIPALRLITIENRTNAEVLEALKNCDFVIDQIYSDTPAATFAMEAAVMGTPSIVGGYGWSAEWLEKSKLGEYPSYVCHPDEVRSAIRDMTIDGKLREKIAAAALRRADEWDYLKVSERIARVLQDDIPPEWMDDPTEIPAFYSGVGLAAPKVAKLVSDLVNNHGVGALRLSDKPSLISKAKMFCQEHGYAWLPEHREG